MRPTPKEIAATENSVNSNADMREWIRTETDPRNLQELFHLIAIHTHRVEYEQARVAIEILLSESTVRSISKLEESSMRLERLTKVLVRFTAALTLLTFGLTVLTVLLLKHPS